MVKVSVVMPNKNKERWLRKSIESVLNQTYKNWELIIVDDHSTDRSREIIREYMDRDDRVVGIFDPDRPFPLTRNIGIEISSGRYLLFLDSDDWIAQDFLKIGVKKITNVDGFASSYKVLQRNGSETVFKYYSGVYSSVEGLKKRFWFGNGNSLLKRKIIEEYGIRFPKYRYSEDVYFYSFYLSVSDKIYVSDYIGFINNRRGSTVESKGNFKVKFKETIKSYELLFKRLEMLGLYKQRELVYKYQLPRSIVTYLDSTPRKYKAIYFVRYFNILLPYLISKRCNGKVCFWVYATVLDSIVPVKWLSRIFKKF